MRLVLSEGSAADCHHAQTLMIVITVDYLLANKAYNTNSIRASAAEAGIDVVILPFDLPIA